MQNFVKLKLIVYKKKKSIGNLLSNDILWLIYTKLLKMSYNVDIKQLALLRSRNFVTAAVGIELWLILITNVQKCLVLIYIIHWINVTKKKICLNTKQNYLDDTTIPFPSRHNICGMPSWKLYHYNYYHFRNKLLRENKNRKSSRGRLINGNKSLKTKTS